MAMTLEELFRFSETVSLPFFNNDAYFSLSLCPISFNSVMKKKNL